MSSQRVFRPLQMHLMNRKLNRNLNQNQTVVTKVVTQPVSQTVKLAVQKPDVPKPVSKMPKPDLKRSATPGKFDLK